MKCIYKNILKLILNKEKQLAVLIDPDKFLIENTACFIKKVNNSIATCIFIGGSIVEENVTDVLVEEIKKHTLLPIILFPGDVSQITNKADALLFLSLISGRNPEYLIEKHIKSVPILRETTLEILPTGYILIDGGKKTAVEQVTNTKPLSRNNIQHIVDTAKSGELLGMQLIYLETGSGAKLALDANTISAVKKELKIPLIVGGGLRSLLAIEKAYAAGADMVVIGTAFEDDESFLEELLKK